MTFLQLDPIIFNFSHFPSCGYPAHEMYVHDAKIQQQITQQQITPQNITKLFKKLTKLSLSRYFIHNEVLPFITV